MTRTNTSQFFLSFFYLLTGFIILDYGYLLLKPFIYGYHFVYFWDLSMSNNMLSWIGAGSCIVLAILLRTPNKSFIEMVYNKEKRTASYYGMGVFAVVFVGMMFFIIAPYVSDILYDYRNNQCLDSFWYCFNFLK